MSNPYKQIFLTYVSRGMFWLIFTIALCGTIGMLGFVFDSQHRRQMVTSDLPHVGFGFPILYYFGFVIIHLKQQIATPYASLLPRYRTPHLVVAALLAAPVVLLVPVIIGLFLPLPILPLLCLNLAFCALLAWAVYRSTFAFMAVALACWFSPALPAVHLFFSHFLTDPSPPNALLSLLFLAAGTLGFAALARRLLHLSEEMPEYARNVATNRWDALANLRGQRTASPVDYRSRWATFFVAPSESQLARITATSHPNFWQRVARWRANYSNRRATLLMGALILLPSLAFNSYSQVSAMTYAWTLLFVLILPISMILGQLLRRWPTLGYESLRPVSRSAFLIENALAIALQVAELWLLLSVLLLAQSAWLSPEFLHTPTPWLSLATAALFQMLFLAFAFWLLRFRSPMLLMSLSFPIIFLLPLLFILSERTFSPAWASLIAALVLLVTLLISYDAFRRWLQTDLD